MPAPIVRADYDRLTEVTTHFGDQAAQLRQMLQSLQRETSHLRQGDWSGQGAQAFYAEMDADVLPTVHRLVCALEAAAVTTRQVGQVARQAEDEAAACFKLNGAARGAGAAVADAAGSVLGGNGPGADEFNTDGMSAFVRPPVKTGTTLRQKIAQGSTALGILAAAISVLEAGGSVAAAGVGTTLGVLLAPIAAFFLGTEIAEGWEKDEALQRDFKQYITGVAMYEAGKLAWVQAVEKNPNLKALNENGVKAVKEITSRWRKTMNAVVEDTYAMEEIAPPSGAERARIWQGMYDAWVQGMSQELFLVYSNPNYHKR